jgi:hypothetical protein
MKKKIKNDTLRTQNNTTNEEENIKKWVIFTYTRKETRYTTKLFKNSS